MLESVKKFFSPLEIDETDFENYKRARGLHIENPWERVKSIFCKDEFGGYHPELINAVEMAEFGALAGSAYGIITEGVNYGEKFKRTNDTNVYRTTKECYRELVRFQILGFGKGVIKWAPKCGLGAGGFALLSSCFELYRNRSGIIEYVIGGAGLGAVAKSGFGPKGMITGGVFGAVFGTFYGTIYYTIQSLSKTDSVKLKYSQYAYFRYRKGLIDKSKAGDFDNVKLLNANKSSTKDELSTVEVQEKEKLSEKKS